MDKHTKAVIRQELEHLSTGQLEQIYEWYRELVHKDDAVLRELDIYHAVICKEIIEERRAEARSKGSD